MIEPTTSTEKTMKNPVMSCTVFVYSNLSLLQEGMELSKPVCGTIFTLELQFCVKKSYLAPYCIIQ